jgi:hypothetical protein
MFLVTVCCLHLIISFFQNINNILDAKRLTLDSLGSLLSCSLIEVLSSCQENPHRVEPASQSPYCTHAS